MAHTFITTYNGNSKTFTGEDYVKVSQEAWDHLDSFSGEIWKNEGLGAVALVDYNGTEHKVEWDLAGNMCEIYPAVFSGLLDRW